MFLWDTFLKVVVLGQNILSTFKDFDTCGQIQTATLIYVQQKMKINNLVNMGKSWTQHGHTIALTDFFPERAIGWSFMTTRCQSKTEQIELDLDGKRGIHS